MLFVVWLEAVSVLWDGFKRSNLPFNLSKLISPPLPSRRGQIPAEATNSLSVHQVSFRTHSFLSLSVPAFRPAV